jgi:NAD(P)-dependent dehydrogenase (short-subunit alcohol dehydrogenase family)
MAPPFSLENKSILITGASSGIGRACAVECSKMGAKVIITARNNDKLQESLSLLEGHGHEAIIADLTNQEDVNRLVDSLPSLNGLVQNAGVGSRILCKNIKASDIDHVFDANVKAPILLQQVLLSRKKIDKEASIVFLASRAANAPSVGNAIYSASKGAIMAYAKVLALELAPRKIRVNCICPAMVWTDLILNDGFSKTDLEEAQLKYPLKRYGLPNDIAYLAIYLLSDASCWMTGSSIDITGGETKL